MHPRTSELCNYLEVQHANLRATFDAVPPERRTRRPSPEQWSPADVIGHLAILESRVADVFSTLISDARARGVRADPETSPVLPTIDITRVLDRSTKFVAPDRVDPHKTQTGLAWSDYERAHDQLTSIVRQTDGLALSDVVHPHPIFGALNMYEWIAFIGAHEARHAEQIRESAGVPTP